jgi:hypothetical protein
VLEWVAEAREEVAAALAMAPPTRGLDGARRALNRAAARLVQVDRERAVEEADEALLASDRESGDEALICGLVHDALECALLGEGQVTAVRPPARPVLRAIAG